MTTNAERPDEKAPEIPPVPKNDAPTEAAATEETAEAKSAEAETAEEPAAEAPAEEVTAEAETEQEAVAKPDAVADATVVMESPPAAGDATMEEAAQDDRVKALPKAGARLEVKLVQVGEKDAFVDWGGPSEGTIAVAELKDDKGELRVPIGETFTAIVRKSEETLEFTVGRGKGGDLLRLRELQAAHEGDLVVGGKIKSTNKGGFEVDLSGVRAFCPFSQIDTLHCETPEEHVGKTYDFHIIAFERGGRNIVVSRRRIMEAAAKEQGQHTRETLEIGQVIEGGVRRLQPYGAFVDIGGVDGLVHVSQISRAHISDPRELLKVGQKVQVKVIGIDALGTKKERISLSMKELETDPWEGAEEKWTAGATVPGTVVRLTEFGAFVELAPGVDGLVHISEIASERIGHPSEVLEPKQKVEARILSVDPESRRISLTLRPEGESPREQRGGEDGGADRAPRRGPGGGRGRRPEHGESSLRQYTSRPDEKKDQVDVSGMEYDDALEALKKKFSQD